jgi:hypothetical protein
MAYLKILEEPPSFFFFYGCIILNYYQWCTKVPILSYLWQHLSYSLVFDNGHFNRHKMVFHYDFDLHFPMNNDIGHAFICLLAFSIYVFIFFNFFYSCVHTMFGSFLPLPPTPSLLCLFLNNVCSGPLLI